MGDAGAKYHALREDYPGHTNGESLANGEENLELVHRAEEGLSSMSTEKNSIVPGVKRDGNFPSEEHTSVGKCRHVCRRWMKCLGWMFELAMDLLRSFHHVILGSKLNVLLLCVPLAIVGVPLQFGQGWVFLLSLLGMAPLAERLGFVTEQLSFVTGSTVGGLLNATFGNATEMIICIFALKNNMIRVVQLSLLGSILSNMLLVLGSAFLFGGLAHPKKAQTFRKATAQVSSGLLLMAVMCLLFPATLHATKTEMNSGVSELILSRFSSIVMLVAYTAYLYFQLRSHRELYDPEGEGVEGEAASDSDECKLAFWVSIAWLTILTIFISILSENLIDAIEGASTSWNVPVSFISVIILPIVGNAAEHASAIMFALKDKLDLSLGVAIGSSTQISMFVIPFCVVIGWPMGTDIDLNFQLFETTTLFITVLVVAFMLQDGTANYFKGLMLVLCYSIVGASFFVHLDHSE
ncbi:hypothetical protein BDL97_01G104600 [Sphagnum fallax]|nr:hypothetical protein BDL97_01G104600 [Sphagnum fallax]KAH8974492.1 hypothetical protein BDL97_01G104600 [Sphagnum fallax]